jgi:nucleoside-diphosphate-sugar epimerase
MADQVLVTGISGFIAKRVALDLLNAGYAVRGTVRSLASGDKVKATLASAGADTSRLSFAEADLTSDAGWANAVKGCRYVQHIASPFPLDVPKDRESLVPAAREGTLRVLDLALKAGVERIVLTSSTVAMMYRPNRPAELSFGENDWSDPEWSALSAYIVSKIRAEKAAWELMKKHGAEKKLTVVNPGFVLGPSLDEDIGTSLQVLELFLKRKYPAIPQTEFPTVDVRDLSELHVKAMTSLTTGGRRLLGCADTLSMPEMASILRSELGKAGKRVPKMVLPDFVIRLMAKFDPSMKNLIPDIGCKPIADAAYVTALTGVKFRSSREAVIATGESLVKLGIVPA